VIEPRTSKPTIRSGGQLLAGGLPIAEVSADGQLAFEDRHHDRCHARGTEVVFVDLCELMDCLLAYLQERQET
jgi:hypothetical protein